MGSINTQRLCKFHEISKVEGRVAGSAWGHYAPQGKEEKDSLGRLNLLTPERVKAAALNEIKTGERVQLDWSLESPQFPMAGRNRSPRKHIDMTKVEGGWYGFDEEIHFNTQASSQWDGFRHFGHAESGLFYGGVTHAQLVDPAYTHLGIHEWCKAGGIAGRGVLVDWLRWRRLTKPELPDLSPVERYEIPYIELIEAAKFQGTDFAVGDILFVRSGLVEWHDTATEAQRKNAFVDSFAFIGVEASPDSVEWFWNQHFAAVAGDTLAFEACPQTVLDMEGKNLHEWFLALWGMPIGEMFDLETLSKKCEELNKWSFFLTSAPLNFPGGVATTPNAIAIL
ncbi:hypothetical protein T439DRAFT_358336 [Meredithblackwellia eburnea MCA 4105]